MANISADTATSTGAPGYITMEQVVADEFKLRAYGFIGDGNSHPLSSVDSIGSTNTTGWTLTQWQTKFPFATALSNEIDGLAVQAVINSVPSAQSYQIIFPAGTWNSSLTISTGGGNDPQGNVRIKGAGQGVTIMNVVADSADVNGWQHNFGQSPDYPLCSLQMEDMAVMCTCSGGNSGGVGLDVTCTTAQGSGLEGAFGFLLDRVIVSGYKTTGYAGNYWQSPIIVRGGGGAYLNKALIGDALATYSLDDVGNALTFNGADSAGSGDIGLTNIIVEDSNCLGYNIGIEFNTSADYGIQGTWICNCNIGCYQGIVYNSTSGYPSPQNFVLDCQLGGSYNCAIAATAFQI